MHLSEASAVPPFPDLPEGRGHVRTAKELVFYSLVMQLFQQLWLQSVSCST